MAAEYKGACSSTIVGIPRDANSLLLRATLHIYDPQKREESLGLLYRCSVESFSIKIGVWQPLIILKSNLFQICFSILILPTIYLIGNSITPCNLSNPYPILYLSSGNIFNVA